MASSIRKRVVYHDKDSANYVRTFSNLVITQMTPQSDIVIDFYEEYLNPLLISSTYFDDKQSRHELSRDPNEVSINRERKCSVTLSVEQALQLAKSILQQYGASGDIS